MILWQLYRVFFTIGALSFGGGYAILPFIQKVVVEEMHWLTIVEMTDVIAISQMTPGPISLNAASFVGTKIAGLSGAVVASIGVITPQCILMLILSRYLFSGKEIVFLEKMLKGLKPAVVGLILVSAIGLVESVIFPKGGFYLDKTNIASLVGMLAGAVLMIKKMDITKIIMIGGIIGLSFTLFLR